MMGRNWIEVSLQVNPEQAEAVADILARFAPGGVALDATHIETGENDEARLRGPLVVRAFLPVDDELEPIRSRLETALWHLGQIQPLPPPAYRLVAETDWSEAWRAHFKPLRLGRRLRVIPAPSAANAEPDEVLICLDPGMAFGTGAHPTTRLCLEAIEQHLCPGQTMLDLGTGSGILAIAAAKLGARAVLALDTDDDAVRIARENVMVNGIVDHLRIQAGSLADVLAGKFGPENRSFDLVVANILLRVIVDLLEHGLAETLAPDGLLIISGILESQADQAHAALQKAGLVCQTEAHLEEWVALIARRPAD